MYREKKRVIGDDYNLIRAFESLGGRVFDVAWIQDGKRLAAVSSEHRDGQGHGRARLYQTEDGAVKWTFEAPASLYTLDVHPENGILAVGGADGVVRRLALDDGSLVGEFSPLPVAEELGGQAVEASSPAGEATAIGAGAEPGGQGS